MDRSDSPCHWLRRSLAGAPLLLLGGCIIPPPPHADAIVHSSPLPHHRIIASLPHHAHPVTYRGQRCWHCDGRYYRRVHGGYALWD